MFFTVIHAHKKATDILFLFESMVASEMFERVRAYYARNHCVLHIVDNADSNSCWEYWSIFATYLTQVCVRKNCLALMVLETTD